MILGFRLGRIQYICTFFNPWGPIQPFAITQRLTMLIKLRWFSHPTGYTLTPWWRERQMYVNVLLKDLPPCCSCHMGRHISNIDCVSDWYYMSCLDLALGSFVTNIKDSCQIYFFILPQLLVDRLLLHRLSVRPWTPECPLRGARLRWTSGTVWSSSTSGPSCTWRPVTYTRATLRTWRRRWRHWRTWSRIGDTPSRSEPTRWKDRDPSRHRSATIHSLQKVGNKIFDRGIVRQWPLERCVNLKEVRERERDRERKDDRRGGERERERERERTGRKGTNQCLLFNQLHTNTTNNV